jgi:uncharacterized protein
MSEGEETLLEFPCRFPIKAMGKADVELELLVIELIRRHSDGFTAHDVTTRPSKNGTYVSVTVTITATSKPQLDAIYRDLSGHPHILMVL